MVDDAASQLEFIEELNNQAGTPKTAEHAYLQAMVEWRRKGNKNEAIKLLD
jgi:hypothetical protein